jgi:hypothetical protein
MKKALLLIVAAFSALICTELIVAKVIGYPTYGVKIKMMGIRGLEQPVNIFKPFSKYWTVEGGNKVYKRNNVGLNGIDVALSNKSKYIFVLGSSFVEASQTPPQKIATSILQNKLQAQNPDYQVLNLGISGHDPYDLYWRLSFYEKAYIPIKVFLVIDTTYSDWLMRQRHPLNFAGKSKTPKRLHSLKMKYAGFMMNHSSFFNLVSLLIERGDRDDGKKNRRNSSEAGLAEKLDQDLIACISNFSDKYKDRFSVVSLAREKIFDSQIRGFCEANRIDFISRNILLPDYQLNGKGHLNDEGNKLLGEMLYESFFQ